MKKGYERCNMRTKNLLKNTLIDLMSEKDFNNITIKEICEIADLNRGTFYLHYQDINDLLASIEDEIFIEFEKGFNRFDVSDLEKNFSSLLRFIFEFFYNNKTACQVLIIQKTDIAFLRKLKEVVRKSFIKYMNNTYKSVDPQTYDYYLSFLVSGCIGIIKNWISNDMQESPEQICKIVESFFTSFRQNL